MSRTLNQMAKELEAEIKESAPHALQPPWWHEVGFADAGTSILSKTATIKAAMEGRLALEAEMRRLNAERKASAGDGDVSRPVSPSRQQAPPSPDKGPGTKGKEVKNGKAGGKNEGKSKGAPKVPPPLPPPHLRTSGATLSDEELESVSSGLHGL